MTDNQNDSNRKKEMTNEHLANERTLLAWVRTAIGVMAFGFVVVKFSLFIRQVAALTGTRAAVNNHSTSAPIGILLVIAGTCSLLFGTWRYYQTERKLKTGEYHHDSRILYFFVSLLLIVSVVIIVYLLETT